MNLNIFLIMKTHSGRMFLYLKVSVYTNLFCTFANLPLTGWPAAAACVCLFQQRHYPDAVRLPDGIGWAGLELDIARLIIITHKILIVACMCAWCAAVCQDQILYLYL